MATRQKAFLLVVAAATVIIIPTMMTYTAKSAVNAMVPKMLVTLPLLKVNNDKEGNLPGMLVPLMKVNAMVPGMLVPLVKVNNDKEAPQILRNLRSKAISHDLAAHNLQGMSQERQTLTLHSIMDNTDTVCNRKLRMGKLGDGGWEICDDEDVRPVRPCVVYSFGISNDFSFDDDTALTYGCHVYSFDPSMAVETHNRSDLVHFYKIGIAGKTKVMKNGWKLYTFSDIRRLLGHENTRIDVVKMDVENAEWGAIKEMSAAGEMKKFKQFLVEYHLLTHDHREHMEVAQIMEREDYKKFYVHKNPAAPCRAEVKGMPGLRTNCYEDHYVRRPGKVEGGGR